LNLLVDALDHGRSNFWGYRAGTNQWGLLSVLKKLSYTSNALGSANRCNYSETSDYAAAITGYEFVQANNESALAVAVAEFWKASHLLTVPPAHSQYVRKEVENMVKAMDKFGWGCLWTNGEQWETCDVVLPQHITTSKRSGFVSNTS
jgi:hypothetical protein